MSYVSKLRIFALLALVCLATGQVARAQGVAVPTQTTAPTVTVYYATYADAKSHVPIDDIKKFGFYQTVADPGLSNQLLGILAQSQRPEITPAPPVNGLFYVEQSAPAASYVVSPGGIVWSGAHCYRLSDDDRKSVGDIIRHQVFTREFWNTSVHFSNGAKFDDFASTNPVNINSLNGKPIIVGFVVDENGKALHPRVVQSCGDDSLDEDACDAVKHQKFTPVMENGEPKRAYFVHTFVVN